MKDATGKTEEKKEKTKEELLNDFINEKLEEVRNLPTDQIKQKNKIRRSKNTVLQRRNK
jgi:hypothetical protein